MQVFCPTVIFHDTEERRAGTFRERERTWEREEGGWKKLGSGCRFGWWWCWWVSPSFRLWRWTLTPSTTSPLSCAAFHVGGTGSFFPASLRRRWMFRIVVMAAPPTPSSSFKTPAPPLPCFLIPPKEPAGYHSSLPLVVAEVCDAWRTGTAPNERLLQLKGGATISRGGGGRCSARLLGGFSSNAWLFFIGIVLRLEVQRQSLPQFAAHQSTWSN